MEKSDLKSGMIVELRNGKIGQVFLDCVGVRDIIANIDENEWYNLENYTKDFKNTLYNEHDIIKVYKPEMKGMYCLSTKERELKLIWEKRMPKFYLKPLKECMKLLIDYDFKLSKCGEDIIWHKNNDVVMVIHRKLCEYAGKEMEHYHFPTFLIEEI